MIKTRLQLFFTAFLQVMLVAANVTFISKGMIIPMLLTGFGISWLWASNVKRIAMTGWKDRLTYASGAMVGTGVGYLVSHLIS